MTDAKERSQLWELYTSQLFDYELRIARMTLTINELQDGMLKAELERRRAKLAERADQVWADRELLKQEYWGFYDDAA